MWRTICLVGLLSISAQAQVTGPTTSSTATTTIPLPCTTARPCIYTCTDGSKSPTFTSPREAKQWKQGREPMVRCNLPEGWE